MVSSVQPLRPDIIKVAIAATIKNLVISFFIRFVFC
jgi:hypothetical protein